MSFDVDLRRGFVRRDVAVSLCLGKSRATGVSLFQATSSREGHRLWGPAVALFLHHPEPSDLICDMGTMTAA